MFNDNYMAITCPRSISITSEKNIIATTCDGVFIYNQYFFRKKRFSNDKCKYHADVVDDTYFILIDKDGIIIQFPLNQGMLVYLNTFLESSMTRYK